MGFIKELKNLVATVPLKGKLSRDLGTFDRW